MASFLGVLGPRLKEASLLWLHGFRDACCLHRVLTYCFRLAIRTGQCFLLNGLIFLGSIFIVNSVVIPTLQWILPDQCPHSGSQKLCSSGGILKLYSFFRLGLLQLFYVFGYSDIAKYGFLVIGKYGPTFAEIPIQPELLSSSNATQMDRRIDIGGYGHDWNKRTGLFSPPFDLFLLGGNPCVLAIFLFSPLVSYGVMAIVFPLFVLTATGLDADKLITSQRSKWKGAGN
ncbi:unnamed protein product [Camellia sinensis]